MIVNSSLKPELSKSGSFCVEGSERVLLRRGHLRVGHLNAMFLFNNLNNLNSLNNLNDDDNNVIVIIVIIVVIVIIVIIAII